MKTKEIFDKKYEFYRNMENKPAIPLEARELILEAMEEYAQERTKDCFPKEFLLWTVRRMESGDLSHFYSDDTFAIYDSDEDLTLDELHDYWLKEVKK